jgi:hypothetical protein
VVGIIHFAKTKSSGGLVGVWVGANHDTWHVCKIGVFHFLGVVGWDVFNDDLFFRVNYFLRP